METGLEKILRKKTCINEIPHIFIMIYLILLLVAISDGNFGNEWILNLALVPFGYPGLSRMNVQTEHHGYALDGSVVSQVCSAFADMMELTYNPDLPV